MNNHDLPEGFKMTELGPLPEEWQVVRLGKVADIRQGRTPKRGDYDDAAGIRIIKVKDFIDGGLVQLVPEGDRSFVNKSSKGLVFAQSFDVLILNAGHSSKVVGQKVGMVPKELNGAPYVGELTAVRANESRTTALYLFGVLQLREVRKRIAELTKGGHLYSSQLASLPIPLPPLPEQRAIADMLRTVQRAKEATEQVLTALHELKKSLMRHLFTYGPVPLDQADQVRLQETAIGPVPEGWSLVRLGDVVNMKQGKVLATRKLTDSGYPVFGANGQIGFYNEFTHLESEVLVTCRGATCGTVNVSPPRSFITNNAMVVTPINSEQLQKDYLAHALRISDLRIAVTGTGQPQITKGKLGLVQIPLPPLPEQRAIAEILRTVDRKIQAEERRKAALDALFKTLLHNLMTGEVRVAKYSDGYGV